jgi:heme oxygenase
MIIHLVNVLTAYRPNKFSKRIKAETKQEHNTIEQHPLIKDLLQGTLPDFKYAIYLTNLLPIYKEIEQSLLSRENNTDIMQSVKIIQDLNLYSTLLNYNFDTPKLNIIFSKDWCNHIQHKTDFYKKTDLYIRWLADMYGGQIIKKHIRYTNKYRFNTLRADIQQVRRMIETDLDDTTIDSFIKEVKTSYAFHYKLVEHVNNCTEKDLVDLT